MALFLEPHISLKAILWQAVGGAHVMADHDDEISMINADMDKVATADGRCAHVPGIPCTPHHTAIGPRR